MPTRNPQTTKVSCQKGLLMNQLKAGPQGIMFGVDLIMKERKTCLNSMIQITEDKKKIDTRKQNGQGEIKLAKNKEFSCTRPRKVVVMPSHVRKMDE